MIYNYNILFGAKNKQRYSFANLSRFYKFLSILVDDVYRKICESKGPSQISQSIEAAIGKALVGANNPSISTDKTYDSVNARYKEIVKKILSKRPKGWDQIDENDGHGLVAVYKSDNEVFGKLRRYITFKEVNGINGMLILIRGLSTISSVYEIIFPGELDILCRFVDSVTIKYSDEKDTKKIDEVILKSGILTEKRQSLLRSDYGVDSDDMVDSDIIAHEAAEAIGRWLNMKLPSGIMTVEYIQGIGEEEAKEVLEHVVNYVLTNENVFSHRTKNSSQQG